MKPSGSREGRPRLAVHLSVVLALKFALLGLLWYLLVMPFTVAVDSPAMGERLAPAAHPSTPKEQGNDRSDRR